MSARGPGAGRRRARTAIDRAFVVVCAAAAALALGALAALLATIIAQGWRHLDLQFLTSFPSRRPEQAGFKPALWGSIWICAVCAAIALPLGVGTAVLLEEYKPRSRALRRAHSFVELNIVNLAGVPSIVYGIIGLTAFVRLFGLVGSPNVAAYDDMLRVRLSNGRIVQGEVVEARPDGVTLLSPIDGRVEANNDEIRAGRTVHVRSHVFTLLDGKTLRGSILEMSDEAILLEPERGGEAASLARGDIAKWRTVNMIQFGRPDSIFHIRLPLGGSVLAGGLTLMLVVLPIVIISTREALRAVPDSLREGAFAAGATRWQMVSRMILPAATPGIMTGSILAMSRAIGEAAPLLVVGGFLFISFTPRNLMDDFAAMPLQIFNWAGRPQEEFHRVAAAGIMVLLAALLMFNAIAVFIRQRFQKPLQ